MRSGITPTPTIVVAFLLTFLGIVFVLTSRNVRAKRIVLPITLLLFSGVWFEVCGFPKLCRRSSLKSVAIRGL